ncbi:MAG: peptidoglycan-associated lipoprotein Pal [Xanthomonadales bacterium]|nr:peptidoglycan-associated lipoprotein Pal [Xanthomonadales bacterium]
MNTSVRALLIALSCAVAVGCAKKEEVRPEPTPAPTPTPTPTPTAPAGDNWTDVALLASKPCLVARTAYFDYDASNVRSEAQEMIRCHARWLQNNPGARMTLEGNADERGSREYNLGLGERRGNAVRDLLLANGASSAQINVVSYGEERPVCTMSDDSCWSKNRRTEIVYTVKQ